MKPLSFVVPIKTASTANLREHWAQKHERTDAQKSATRRQLDKGERPGPLLVVRLTRVSPRPLDDDNLRGALKSVRDAIATWLRVDDRTCLVRWDYEQEKGEPCVRVEVLSPLACATNDGPPASERERFVDSVTAEVAEAFARAVAPAPARPRRLAPRELAALATPASYPAKGGAQ